ncbi:MAG: S41 family peptidase [Bacteroidales bacterium]|nr:S41 family peptidase [Bacteroidales bacterium]MBO7530068.1 S41 family peptidase [Bacteroidales bacterium]
MRHKFLTPVYLAVAVAFGVLLGIIIARSNDAANTFINKGGDMTLVDKVFYLIENDYVDTVNINKLQVEAVNSVIDLMDPHSEYFEPEVLEEVTEDLQGSFEGIGVTFRIEKDTVTIISTIKGGPSEKCGIMAGDRIVYVGDSLIAGKNINNNKVMKMLKGPRGTKVDVKIFRRGVTDLIDFTITRGVIPTYSVDAAYMLNETTGYIKLEKFIATTHKEFVNAVKKLQKQGMQELVFDLRGNAGGYLSEAVDIADEFLPKGSLIVYTQGEHRSRQYIFARRHGMLEDTPVKILIDEGSASASEIVAGALQDNDRGTIIGRRSFGKGLVQEQFDLGDGAGLRLTVARYYTPTGRCIQKPYDGDREKYILEAYDRYDSGEMFSADSIHFADSLKYVTPGGKTVYGGGGIMPDVYVPLKQDSTEYFFNKIVNASIVFQYAFDYSDAHREELLKYGDEKNFDKKFKFTDAMWDEILKEAQKKKVTGTDEQKAVAKEKAKILVKAYIARNIFGDEAFYPLYQPMDEMLKECLKN